MQSPSRLLIVVVVFNFPLFFRLWDITVAPRQRLNKEECSDTDGLDLAQTTCMYSVCVAHLTPWIFGRGTKMAN